MRRTKSVTEGIASKANYSPVYSDTQSPAGYAIHKSQRTGKGKNVNVKKKENPNYNAGMSFGQGNSVKPLKAKSYKKK